MTDYPYYEDRTGDDPPAGHGRPARFDPRRRPVTDRFGTARRHSRRVRTLKFLLPVVAIGGIVGFFVVMRPAAQVGELAVTMDGINIEDRSVTMDRPRISGFDGTRSAYEVEAVRAVQDLSNPDIMRMERVQARFGLGDGVTAIVHATTGFYNSSGKGLVLKDGITLKTSNGYDGTFEEVEIDVDRGTLFSTRPVTLGGKEGTIRANAMEIHDRGKRIVFSNGVDVTYNPPADAAPIAEGATQPGAVPAAAAPTETAGGAS